MTTTHPSYLLSWDSAQHTRATHGFLSLRHKHSEFLSHRLILSLSVCLTVSPHVSCTHINIHTHTHLRDLPDHLPADYQPLDKRPGCDKSPDHLRLHVPGDVSKWPQRLLLLSDTFKVVLWQVDLPDRGDRGKNVGEVCYCFWLFLPLSDSTQCGADSKWGEREMGDGVQRSPRSDSSPGCCDFMISLLNPPRESFKNASPPYR